MGADARIRGVKAVVLHMREVPCAACGGARLAPGVLAVTVGGRSIAQAAALPLGELAEFVRALELVG